MYRRALASVDRYARDHSSIKQWLFKKVQRYTNLIHSNTLLLITSLSNLIDEDVRLSKVFSHLWSLPTLPEKQLLRLTIIRHQPVVYFERETSNFSKIHFSAPACFECWLFYFVFYRLWTLYVTRCCVVIPRNENIICWRRFEIIGFSTIRIELLNGIWVACWSILFYFVQIVKSHRV